MMHAVVREGRRGEERRGEDEGGEKRREDENEFKHLAGGR